MSLGVKQDRRIADLTPIRVFEDSDSALPLCRLTRCAENRDDHDSLSFDRKIDSVGKSAS
jgi:hypothetical protein